MRPLDDFDTTRQYAHHDKHARHWVILEDDCVVAAARLCVHKSSNDIPDVNLFPIKLSQYHGPFGSLNRLVVSPDYRKRGFARKLDEIRLESALRMGCQTVLVCTPVSNSRTLKSLGFISVSEFDIAFPSITPKISQTKNIRCNLLIYR